MSERTTQEERERWRANCGVCAEIALVPDNWPARCRRLLDDLDAAEAKNRRLREALCHVSQELCGVHDPDCRKARHHTRDCNCFRVEIDRIITEALDRKEQTHV